MIKEDRVELNERFIKVFHTLEDKGIIIKNDRSGRGVGDVAEKVLGNKSYGHIIRAYLDKDSKRVVDYGQARQFCRAYGINEEYMIEGVGSPFGSQSMKSSFIPNGGNEMRSTSSGNILLTSVQAFAGTSVGLDAFAREQNNFFSLPGVSGSNLVAFPINGNSMEPIISNGDIVVCRELQSLLDVKDNEIYAMRHNGSVWIKYVQMIKTRGRITHVKLISANYLEHDPFVEELNEYSKMYKVIRRISQF
jgi:hypothetical protein